RTATSPATVAPTTAITATTAVTRTATLVPSPVGTTAAGTTVNVAASCRGLPDHNALRTALAKARAEANGGFNLDMWVTIVNRDGVVCAVAFTGQKRGDQWPGSRV